MSGISADILEVNDFYAWGQEIKSRSWSNESERYLRGYQGMLLENTINGEANMYSTEFRMFDCRLGRWMSMDALTDQFPWMSPFVGMDNNPVMLVDPLGLESMLPEAKVKTKKTWLGKHFPKLNKFLKKYYKKYKEGYNKVKEKLYEASKKAWEIGVKSANKIWDGAKIGLNKAKDATFKGLQATEQGINKLKNMKIKSGLMTWADGSGGTENPKDRSNPAGSIDIGYLLKMFDLFSTATKTKGDNQIGGPPDKYTGVEKSNDVKEINDYDPKEVDEDFEAIDNLSKNKKSPVVRKQSEKTIKIVIFKNNYRDDGSIWSTSREGVIEVSKSKFNKNYNDAFKLEGDSEANYGVNRD